MESRLFSTLKRLLQYIWIRLRCGGNLKSCSVIECFYPVDLHFVFVVAFASIMWHLRNAVHLAWIISSQELWWRVVTVIKSPPRCLTLESGTSVPRCFWRTLHSSPNEFFRQNACFSKILFSACGFSISCVMDFIVIIKKPHVQVIRVWRYKTKWWSCSQIELRFAS